MRYLSLLLLGLLLLPMFTFAQTPVSKQATLVETISSAEVLIEASGIYISTEKNFKAKLKDVEANGITRATDDAKRSAVWLLVMGGTDPILRDQEEIDLFNLKSSQFYNNESLSRYVTYEDQRFINRVSLEEGRDFKITKRFKLNKELLLRDLEEKDIISGRQELAEALGRPQLMVIPQVAKGVSPLDYMRSDNLAQYAATVIESHLTAKQYEVLAAQQLEQITTLSGLQTMVVGGEEDIAYQLALSIGSDVYLTYAGTWETASHGTKRYSITVSAYETTTARLLGSETGYSQARQGEAMICVEEAATGAIDAVLSRIDAYWRDDLRRGVQYKIILSLDGSFSEDEAFDLQDDLIAALQKMSKSYKEVASTSRTLDLQVWVDPSRYSSSRNLYRELRTNFNQNAWGAELSTVNLNRKLLLLKLQ
ncbi:MAG: hypothetical protein GX122_04445 [Candidatus Cloacimonetes bacterium]|nr:hypothetical protein [Candidatus Cloacimonadota bacterium]